MGPWALRRSMFDLLPVTLGRLLLIANLNNITRLQSQSVQCTSIVKSLEAFCECAVLCAKATQAVVMKNVKHEAFPDPITLAMTRRQFDINCLAVGFDKSMGKYDVETQYYHSCEHIESNFAKARAAIMGIESVLREIAERFQSFDDMWFVAFAPKSNPRDEMSSRQIMGLLVARRLTID